MIGRMWLAAAVASLVLAASFGRAETTLLLDGDRQSLPLSLDVRLGDRTVDEAWDSALEELCKFFDRNGDSTLDGDEAARLPSPFALRQTLWGQFALDFELGRSPPTVPTDGKLSFAQVAAHYRQHGVGNAVVATGRVAATKHLNDALVRLLDTDKNGYLDVSELRVAEKLLAPLDLNDDELVGPGELSRSVTSYPGTAGTVLVKPIAAGKPDATTLSYRLPVEAKLGPQHALVAGKQLKIELPAEEAGFDETASDESSPWTTITIEGLTLHVRRERGLLPARTREIAVTAGTWFDKHDTNRDDLLTGDETDGLQRAAFQRSLAVADRDGDMRLSRIEYDAWIDLQSRIAEAQVLVTVIDCERSLFEQLDADHDGGLSVRELRTSAARLGERGLLVGDRLRHEQLPRVLLSTVSRGHPRSLLVVGARVGPSWFRAMDRNGDGDVSKRESLLGAEAFRKLDADHDGLLSADEAADAETKGAK